MNSSTLIQSEQEYGFEDEKFEKLKSRSRTSSRSRRQISITDGPCWRILNGYVVLLIGFQISYS